MITRRRAIGSTAAIAGWTAVAAGISECREGADYENPYDPVDWELWTRLDSMSHQHQGQTAVSLDLFREMGYGHFAFSNYYPSAPTFPLPESWRLDHPEIVAAPNAEQHSFLDTGLHANSLGSLLATGYGSTVPAGLWKSSPLEHRFTGLTVSAESRPWEGVYRLDLRLAGESPEAAAVLTIEGGTECIFKEGFPETGTVTNQPCLVGDHTLYIRAAAAELGVKLVFDPAVVTITQFRLMQGSNRPWRDVFRSVLDGEMVEGTRRGGLLHPEGGGITLNHPGGSAESYAEMLDFDPRVLGIEVWNQLTSGFGSQRGFYEADPRLAPDRFYRLWDEILKTGRRCWGFFVKDHNTYGRGRNVLLVPPLEGLSAGEREAAALRAYRAGTFFGAVSSIATNEAGEVVAPYDRSSFRFERITLRRDAEGNAVAFQVAVGGQDGERLPQVQIRIITDAGIAEVIEGQEGEWKLPRGDDGRAAPLFVRVEAIAYPDKHANGERLTPETMRGLGVAEIARLHDRQVGRGRTFFGNPGELRTPVPLCDLIFSQPIRRV